MFFDRRTELMIIVIDVPQHSNRTCKKTLCQATITLCDLSARFLCVNAVLLCEFESDTI